MSEVLHENPNPKKMAKKGYFGVDMHFHTVYSVDGFLRSRDVIKYAQKRKIGVAIADHNTIIGAVKAYRNRKGAMIIPAIEVTTRRGVHVLVYFYGIRELQNFFKKEIEPKLPFMNPYYSKLSVLELLEKSKDYNCIVCAPHPFGPFSPSLEKIKIRKKIVEKFDAIEVMNSFNLHNDNIKALQLAMRHNKPMTGGTDGHTIFEFGTTLTFAKSRTIDGFLGAVMKKKVKIIGREDPVLQKILASGLKQTMYFTRSFFTQTFLPYWVKSAHNYINYIHKNNRKK